VEPIDGDVHVAPHGDDDARGRVDSPLATIQAAADRLDGGGVVAVADGTYDENLALTDHDGVEVRGRCPAAVTLAPTEPTAEAISLGSDVVLRGLTIVAPHAVEAVVAVGGTHAEVRDVVFRDPHKRAITAYGGARVDVRDVEIHDVTESPEGTHGRGLEVSRGALIDARRVLIDGAVELGINCNGGRLNLEDVVVRDVVPRGIDESGWGLNARGGCTAEIAGLTIEASTNRGINITGVGTSVVASGVRVADVDPADDDGSGFGIRLSTDASLELSDSVVERATGSALLIQNGADAVLRGVELLDTRRFRDTVFGRGLEMYGGSTLDAEDLSIRDAVGIGILVGGGDDTVTTAEVRGLSVTGTSRPDRRSARAVEVAPGGRLTLRGADVRSNEGIGLRIHGPDAVLVAIDSTVADMRTGGTLHPPHAVDLIEGGRLEGEDLRLEDNRGYGVTVVGSEVVLAGGHVTGTTGSWTPGSGAGILAQLGGTVTATGTRIADNAAAGLVATTGGAITCRDCDLDGNGFAGAAAVAQGRIELDGGRVTASRPSGDFGGGVGVYAWGWEYPGAPAQTTLVVTGTEFADTAHAPVYLLGDGDYRLEDVEIAAAGRIPAVLAIGPLGPVGTDVGEDGHVGGLRLRDVVIGGEGLDAVVLHGAGATLENVSFAGTFETDVYRQQCVDEAALVTDVDPVSNACEGWARPVLPSLDLTLALIDPDVQ